MTGLTRQLGEFAASSGTLRLSEAVRRTVRNGFIDTVATMLAGRDEPVTQIVQRLAHAQGASSRNTALVSATAAHALDYDDVALQGHPSVVLVPALRAEGERLGASGEQLLRAYVVGYETWAELIARDDAFVARADVQRLMQRVRIATTDSGEVTGTRGDARTPLSDAELAAKFHDCCAGVEDVDTARVLASLMQLISTKETT